MTQPGYNSAWVTGSVVASSAITLACLGGSWGEAVAHVGLVLLGMLAIALPAVLVGRRWYHQQRRILRHVEALTTLDYAQLCESPPELPPLERYCPWREALRALTDRLVAKSCQSRDSEEARAALELRARRGEREQERINAILAGLNEAVLVVDEYGELALANPIAERLLGIADAREGALQQLTRCEKLLALLNDVRQRNTLTTRSDEMEIPDEDGQPCWYQVSASNLASEQEQGPRGAVAVLHDISSLKAAQRRHAEFVSAVSHEMKTPLASIKAYVEMLADGDAEDEETREEFLRVINSQAERLQRLIDNLLNLARIESGVVQINKQVRSLNELVEEALEVVRPAAEEKQIELGVELSPMYLRVLVDRDQIMQAAINLLSNAIKYTPEGGRVTVRTRSVDSLVRMEVEDTGVGLDPADCCRVFDKFYRVNKDKNMAPGTGLGLPLARSIVEDMHGGFLAVESEQGQGSTFAIGLPGAEQLS